MNTQTQTQTHAEKTVADWKARLATGDYTEIHIHSAQDMQRLWDQYGMDIYHTGDHNIVIVGHVGQW